jgi:hypothetical protein
LTPIATASAACLARGWRSAAKPGRRGERAEGRLEVDEELALLLGDGSHFGGSRGEPADEALEVGVG